MKKVAIIMGSDSDLPVMKAAAQLLENFGLQYDLTIISAHRTPERLIDFSKDAHKEYSVIIAGAGGAAHLPGMVASMTHLPVIGVPVKSSNLNGIDSLLSIVQMPKGVCVATVAINNSYNAALLAIQIIGLNNDLIKEKLINFRINQTNQILTKAEELEKIKWKSYLEKI